ncbi:MAG TPA: EAL domain-containing protein [Acidimicrobiia bacterium]|nr:EAL domain-containing protein [Acidimicrobiia bacterium]
MSKIRLGRRGLVEGDGTADDAVLAAPGHGSAGPPVRPPVAVRSRGPRRRVGPLRGLSVFVFVAFAGGSLALTVTTRRLVADQEQRLLTQQAGEAAALLTNLMGSVQTSVKALTAVVQATNEDPAAYLRVAGGVRSNLDVAMIKETGGRFRVVAAKGGRLGPDTELPPQSVDVLRRAGDTDDLVPSPVFRLGDQRRIAFAMRTGATPGAALVYGETVLAGGPMRGAVTGTQAFSDIEVALYAGSRIDPEQVVITTRELPIPGKTVQHTVQVGAQHWRLVVGANRPLVGSMASNEPRLLLLAGLLATLLMTALVEVLLRRRGYALSMVDEQTEILRQRTDDLAHLAVHDTLTGLPNRVLLSDRLEQALRRTARTNASVAVLFIDLDRFKFVNDSRGHAVGDELLVAVADRLRSVVRSHDTVARFGGDEFVVVCEDVDAAVQASVLAERIAETLREPVLAAGQEVFLGASIGIAVADGDTDSPESLLRDADAAMYRAKDRGRDRCEFFDAVMRTEAVARLEMQSALHRAVERDELRLHYQPVVDLATGAVCGVEALVRWARPHHGLVAPGAFIPLAEETGLIVPIGAWVLEEAVRQVARWQESHPGLAVTVNVNLSAAQLRQPDLAGTLADLIAAHGIAPGALCLELTESTFMEEADGHGAALAALKALGVHLAIDDFGTGYSSLTYLKRFPVNVLKIDQAFVGGLGRDASDTAIVRSVVDLAHALGLTVVAEGVETADQAAHLGQLGCDLAQGYYFARPLPADQLDTLLGRRTDVPVLTRPGSGPGATPGWPAG